MTDDAARKPPETGRTSRGARGRETEAEAICEQERQTEALEARIAEAVGKAIGDGMHPAEAWALAAEQAAGQARSEGNRLEGPETGHWSVGRTDRETSASSTRRARHAIEEMLRGSCRTAAEPKNPAGGSQREGKRS